MALNTPDCRERPCLDRRGTPQYERDRTDADPIITLVGARWLAVNLGGPFVDPGARATDSDDGDLTAAILTTGAVNSGVPGAYRLAYNVEDSDKHHAHEQVRMVFVVDPAVPAATRAFEYLAASMDRFNEAYDVYSDFLSAGNHGTPSGWMGKYQILAVDPAWGVRCFAGLTCFKNIWQTTEPGWVGIRWLQPDNNWATIPDAGADLRGATRVRFYARGELGGEPVEFVAGGLSGAFPDSLQPAASSGVLQLTKEWAEYSISLAGKDLSHVVSPFGWVVKNDPIFYVDAVSYDVARPQALRLIQSFEVLDLTTEAHLANTAYVYDNALALLAFLARGSPDDRRRAKLVADALVFAVSHDRAYKDGRLRNAYMAGDLAEPATATARIPGWWNLTTQQWQEDRFNVSTHTGNIAWAMLALLTAFDRLGDEQYLSAAIRLGEWVDRESRDTRGAGGYTAGYEGWEPSPSNPSGPKKLLYKATEHNIDLYPAFIRLHRLTQDGVWLERAEHARAFVSSMWDPTAGHFWTGTGEDGTTANNANVPIDIQAWAVLAMPAETEYRRGLAWAEANGRVEADGLKGFDFNTDRDGIWFEGTAQMATAHRICGSVAAADALLIELRKAQALAMNGNGKGLVAASHDGVSTGFDWEYFSRVHLGATAWFLFAELGFNPYW